MDWSRAKNALIVAFILTNIFLIYHIQKDMFNKGDLQIISDTYIKNAENYLTDNGLQLDIEIPREVISLPVLMVKYKVFEPYELARNFLGENFELLEGNIYKAANKKLEIISNKKFVYKNVTEDKKNYPLDEEAAIDISNNFLYQHNFLQEDLVLRQIYFGLIEEFGEIPLYKLVYHQTYNGRFLGESYVHVYVSHTEVVGMEAMLLEQENIYGQKKRVIPATEALLRKMNEILLDNKEDKGIAVKEMEIGYYFNPADFNFTTWDTIISGTAFPSWKIVLNNGKIYYVDALKD
ncbi:hypothetical protein CACET_c39040 [Clostridium aceticum]|uniref:Uncharacterized protein n=1 Tax=Clostridium aceticum TaxID=84022 RepID=A0A0D8I8H3_9CLOT|nr:two-component system regulatory protein YycI [Clostridium aceticum]AKL97332.1 hypothetical protein CACET_c39040 [Clostridium aceticum]KJF26344.1 hypothetical protein TZ02_14360 [Clostridium aceticum]